MTLPEYLSDVARQMRADSAAIRRDFATHHLSAGENREGLVEDFLKGHLPARFGVDSGLVISHDGMFSNQADLVVVDRLNNAPLYTTLRNGLWPVEAVYSLVEVKTMLGPSELRDAISKGRRFKNLPRRFADTGTPMRISDSLFVVWGFDAPAPETFKKNLFDELLSIPVAERPDLIVVPDKLLAAAGTYFEVSRLGQPGSPMRQRLAASGLPPLPVAEVDALGDNSLLGWFIWFDSWLRQAGSRFTSPADYMPPDMVLGNWV